MTSKHYGWQRRWMIDTDNLLATHKEHGLVVAFTRVGHRIVPDMVNFNEVLERLQVKNGHNADSMLERAQREALTLMQEALGGRIYDHVRIIPKEEHN